MSEQQGPAPLKPNYVSDKPRKVRGGVRLVDANWPTVLSWGPRRWLGAMERCATAESLRLGADYARKGQTRTLDIHSGGLRAAVQGRMIGAYRVTIEWPVFSADVWEQATTAMVDQAIHAAKLLAGELPQALEDLFAELNSPLVPGGPEDLRWSCTCGANRDDGWCKHASCAGFLVAQAMQREPFIVFTMRGLPAEELVERLRQRRATTAAHGQTAARGGAVVAIEGVTGPGKPLEDCGENFWDAGAGLEQLETPLREPEVRHALLRRLGPTPFKEGKFPLVGLLATCYETIGREAREAAPGVADATGVDQSES